jgi:hypothetical protein
MQKSTTGQLSSRQKIRGKQSVQEISQWKGTIILDQKKIYAKYI